MAGNYDDLSRAELIGLLRKRDLSRRLGLVWERDEIEREKLLESELPLVELDEGLSRGARPWANLLVEGDNFPALRFLRSAYKGAIKCIYIDPPYKTGNRDFVSNDRYLDPDNAFRHSTWLEFLYRRLSIARDLLREDGVLLVSINDENRAHLELLLAQIWPGGRRGSLVWRSRNGDDSGKGANLSVNHEHILVWAGKGFRFRGDEKSSWSASIRSGRGVGRDRRPRLLRGPWRARSDRHRRVARAGGSSPEGGPRRGRLKPGRGKNDRDLPPLLLSRLLRRHAVYSENPILARRIRDT